LLVTVLRIRNELLAFGVHHEIQILQRNLSQEVRHVVIYFHDLEGPIAAHEFKTHGREDCPAANPVGGLRVHLGFFVQPERFNQTGLEVEPGRASVHEHYCFNGLGFSLEELPPFQLRLEVVRQSDFGHNFSHARSIFHSNRAVKLRKMKPRRSCDCPGCHS
jgi:hypothetical protein